jgi:hypothetical protein
LKKYDIYILYHEISLREGERERQREGERERENLGLQAKG